MTHTCFCAWRSVTNEDSRMDGAEKTLRRSFFPEPAHYNFRDIDMNSFAKYRFTLGDLLVV